MQSPFSKQRTISTKPSKHHLPTIKMPNTHRTQQCSILTKHKELPSRHRAITQMGGSRNKHFSHNHHSGLMEKKLEKEVEHILELFKQINRLRQHYGVISLREEDQDDTFYLQPREVTYSADIPQLNQQICTLKTTIQSKIDKVLSMAKYFPSLQTLIQELLEEQSQANVTENARVGRIAAMKAQRRLIECSQLERQKIGW